MEASEKEDDALKGASLHSIKKIALNYLTDRWR